MLSLIQKYGTAGRIVKTVVMIELAHGLSDGKCGTHSGTKFVSTTDHPRGRSYGDVVSKQRSTVTVSARCPAPPSRSLIAESVVFIGCPAVPRFVRTDRNPARNVPPHEPVSAPLIPVGYKPAEGGKAAPKTRVAPRVRSGGGKVDLESVLGKKERSIGRKHRRFPADHRGIFKKQE